MSAALLCFAATFVSVFALGLQSLNVNQGHYWAAAFTSLLIGGGHIALYRYMPSASMLELAAYLVGGVTGIVFSMWFHRTVKAWWRARQERQVNHPIRGQFPPKAPPPRAWTKTPCECGRRYGEPCPRLVCERYTDEHADVYGSTRLH